MEKIKANNFEEFLYHEQLSCGLNVYILPLKYKKNYSCMYITKYGGRNINFKLNDKLYQTHTGIAHFLEHKMFERKDDPFKFYGKFGTDVNALTSLDYTGYYFLGNNSFNRGLKYMLNWLKELYITDKSVIKEQGIILEEASMYKDNPDRVLYNKVRENIFVNDPSKYKVIGTDEDIVAITKEELELCFNTFYSQNNMYLIMSGNMNPEKTINIVKEQLKDIKPNNNKIEKIYNKEPDNVAKEYEEINMNIQTPKVTVGYKINKEYFKDLNLTDLELDIYLHSIFDIALGTTSLIREKWLNDNLFLNSFYRISEIETHYLIELYATTEKPKELIDELLKYITDLKIDEESFAREKKLWIASEIKATDSPMSAVYSVLDDILDYGEYIPNKIEIVKKLDYQTLVKVKESLNFNNRIIIKILPKSN